MLGSVLFLGLEWICAIREKNGRAKLLFRCLLGAGLASFAGFAAILTVKPALEGAATDNAIRRSSKFKIFYQFVGIGYENFRYLKKLDDLDGRAVDNTAFIKVEDFSRLNDDQLYAKLLEQYPQWLRAMNII